MAASLAMQKAVVAALADLPGVTGVFDGPAADAAAPYVVIGPDAVGDWGHKTGIGHEHRILVTVWDDRPGAARLKAVMGDAEQRLQALAGTWDGHRIVLARVVRMAVGGPDQGWRPGLIDVRVLSEAM